MSQSKVLADRIYPAEGLAADAVRIAAANILLVLCAHIAFPLPWTPVPITGQTFGVLLVAVLLGSRRGALTLGLYLLEGIVGLPVFQPLGLPGPARFLGPTAGYLLAYPPAAFVTGWIAERSVSVARSHIASLRASTVKLIGALVSGEIIIFAGGCAWLALLTGVGWSNSFRIGALPFLPGEVIKMALVVAAVGGLNLARPKNSN
ncbi:MAG TPA: biotin transporter BioY [Candidatus Acidoferrales bacterium]|nr:biotin transporter BioY [Candidatus Acidoferrales bacterium]